MSNTEIIKSEAFPLDGEALERFIVGGDLSVLSPEMKSKHYLYVCNSLGLNPSTKPFEYIKLNGREVLYARRDCTDQLRSLRNVTITIVSRERIDEIYAVTARATMPDGRSDESIGAVTIVNLKGDNLANALMKAETKAKRRVTLSICGLGFTDESELETIHNKSAPVDRSVEEAKERWIAWFERAGISLQRAAASVGRKSFRDVTAEDLASFQERANALKDSDSDLETMFPKLSKKPSEKTLDDVVEEVSEKSKAKQ